MFHVGDEKDFLKTFHGLPTTTEDEKENICDLSVSDRFM